MPDIHFIWRPANWPDRPNRALRAFHGFGEYLVGFYGFNACRQSRWFAHRTFIFCGRQSYGLTDGPLFSRQVFMVVYHATALFFIVLDIYTLLYSTARALAYKFRPDNRKSRMKLERNVFLYINFYTFRIGFER